MKGAIGFLVGIIGLCLFASLPMLIPQIMGPREGIPIVLILVVVAFVFLNVLIVGFFRMLGHLHDTALYPDDPQYHPLRGRVLFFLGYIGLLLTLVFALMVAFLPQLTGFRVGHRQVEGLLVLAWFIGWVFFGCLLGGVLMLLSDIYHKSFFRTLVGPPGDDRDELDISRRGPRRRSRRADDEETAHDWREE